MSNFDLEEIKGSAQDALKDSQFIKSLRDNNFLLIIAGIGSGVYQDIGNYLEGKTAHFNVTLDSNHDSIEIPQLMTDQLLRIISQNNCDNIVVHRADFLFSPVENFLTTIIDSANKNKIKMIFICQESHTHPQIENTFFASPRQTIQHQ